MAFKVKKRPNVLQGLIAGIGQGFGAGIQAGANMYQEQLMKDYLTKKDFKGTRLKIINDFKSRYSGITDEDVNAEIKLFETRMAGSRNEEELGEIVKDAEDYIRINVNEPKVFKPEDKVLSFAQKKSVDYMMDYIKRVDNGNMDTTGMDTIIPTEGHKKQAESYKIKLSGMGFDIFNETIDRKWLQYED